MEFLQLEGFFRGLAKGVAAIAAWGLLFFVLEAVIPWLSVRLAKRKTASWRRERDVGFFKRDFLLEFSLPLLNQALQATLLLGPMYAFMSLLDRTLPQHILASRIADLHFDFQVFYAMLVMDLAVYAEHRFVHRFAWPFHAVHHAAKELTWITAFRIHPGNAVTTLLFHSLFGWLLGFSGAAWVAATTIVLFLGMLQHSNLNWDWGFPLRYVIVSPNFHKWHHVKRDGDEVRNFCLVFPFLDLLFGTFYFPEDERPSDFGIRDAPDEAHIPRGLLAQVWYPFGRCLRVVRGWLANSDFEDSSDRPLG